jgi:hypothetical protein
MDYPSNANLLKLAKKSNKAKKKQQSASDNPTKRSIQLDNRRNEQIEAYPQNPEPQTTSYSRQQDQQLSKCL